MKTQKSNSIEKNNTLDILDEIQEVKVSPFLKNQVLNKIREQKEDKVPLFGWLSPQLQLATILVILIVNATTIFYTLDAQDSSQQLSGFEAFMKDYSLDSDNGISLN